MHSAATRQHQNYLAKNLGNSEAKATADKLYNKVLEYSKKSDAFGDIDRQLYNKGRDFAPNVYKKPAKAAANAPKTGTDIIEHPTYPNIAPELTKVQQKVNTQNMKNDFKRKNRIENSTKNVPASYKPLEGTVIDDNFIDPSIARAQQKVNNQKLKTEFRNRTTQNVPVNTVPKVEPVDLDTRSWVRKHPYKTAAIAGAAGTGAYLYNKNRDR